VLIAGFINFGFVGIDDVVLCEVCQGAVKTIQKKSLDWFHVGTLFLGDILV